jgi:protein ImuA
MALPLHSREIAQVVAELSQRVRQIERPRPPAGDGLVSSGDGRLDRLLPEGGFRRGTLVEWLAAGDGSGAGTLALIAAREAAADGGAIVVIDPGGMFYPPGAVRLGIDLQQLIVVRPADETDRAWALDQVLRTRGVAAVWCPVDAQDDHTLRRWQLAAETSGVVGLLVRPASLRHEPSWAELRLLVEPRAASRRAGRTRRLRVTLTRSRAGRVGRAVELEIAPPETRCGELFRPAESRASRQGTRDETRFVHLASSVAAAKTRRRSRRA